MWTPALKPADHSLTYGGGLRNLPHRRRLRAIVAELKRVGVATGTSFADVGCSNGYITAILRDALAPARTVGFDPVEANLERGRVAHPGIEFRAIDLNRPLPDGHDAFGPDFGLGATDVLDCSGCPSGIRIVATVLTPDAIRRILRHENLPVDPPPLAPALAPPPAFEP